MEPSLLSTTFRVPGVVNSCLMLLTSHTWLNATHLNSIPTSALTHYTRFERPLWSARNFKTLALASSLVYRELMKSMRKLSSFVSIVYAVSPVDLSRFGSTIRRMLHLSFTLCDVWTSRGPERRGSLFSFAPHQDVSFLPSFTPKGCAPQSWDSRVLCTAAKRRWP